MICATLLAAAPALSQISSFGASQSQTASGQTLKVKRPSLTRLATAQLSRLPDQMLRLDTGDGYSAAA